VSLTGIQPRSAKPLRSLTRQMLRTATNSITVNCVAPVRLSNPTSSPSGELRQEGQRSSQSHPIVDSVKPRTSRRSEFFVNPALRGSLARLSPSTVVMSLITTPTMLLEELANMCDSERVARRDTRDNGTGCEMAVRPVSFAHAYARETCTARSRRVARQRRRARRFSVYGHSYVQPTGDLTMDHSSFESRVDGDVSEVAGAPTTRTG